MSHAVCKAVGMKKKRIILEPELEKIAGDYGVFDRLWMAEKLERWIRQLRVSARAMAHPSAKRRKVKRVALRVARLN